MPKKQYWAHILTGGAAGALDLIDGTALNDLDMAYVVTADLFYTYTLDADSGASESSPDVISPDTNAGTKRWILTGIGAGITTFTNTGLHIFDTDASHDLIIKPGSDLGADRTLTLTTGDAARTITLSGNPTLDDWFDQAVKAASSPTFNNLTLTTLTETASIILMQQVFS